VTDRRTVALVSFIGAGPGAPDLITLRGRDRIAAADLVIYADSLVHPGIAAYARDGAEVRGSAGLTLEQAGALILDAARAGKRVARVQSGDPSVYGALHEQIVLLERERVAYEIVPGVSSAFAAAAALNAELTVPGLTQTVIFTRLGARTPMPEQEALARLAEHGASMAIFLSAPMIDRVVVELLAGGYAPDTPSAAVYRVSWEDELILRGTLGDIAAQVKAAKLQLQTLILVGPALAEHGDGPLAEARSNLYHPGFSQRHRRASATAPGAGGES
jgi:precorrin-4/cobalt-precorrin-4 C11-methyltransferase